MHVLTMVTPYFAFWKWTAVGQFSRPTGIGWDAVGWMVMAVWYLMIKALWSCETSGNSNPLTLHHLTAKLNLQQAAEWTWNVWTSVCVLVHCHYWFCDMQAVWRTDTLTFWVYVYMYMYIYIYIYMCVCVCVCMYVCMYMCMCVCVCMCTMYVWGRRDVGVTK